MNHIDAMKQAVEWANGHGEVVFWGGGWGAVAKMNKWLEALRQAIEQAEKKEPVGFVHPEDLQSVTLGHNSYAAIYVETEGHTGGIPLYTSPPQREWVGLTDEEIIYEWELCRASIPRYFGFARGIADRLRSKNHVN